jgi:dTDP-4-dehydrorhamnose reductase
MKMLVLGGNGMAGHMITKYMKTATNDDVFYTSRNIKDKEGIYLDVANGNEVREVILTLKPDVVINCVGLLNENASRHQVDAIRINSLFPHQVAQWTQQYGGRLVQISTDCVFSGKEGNYEENMTADGTTIYAKTKALGEVSHYPHLTIRTSIIGPELKEGVGLFQWFMKQSGQIKGFKEVFWNGVTTLELAKGIMTMIEQSTSGIYHLVAPEIVSKYRLLKMIQHIFNKEDVQIQPDDNMKLDRTLRNTRKDLSYNVATYQEMLTELREWMDHDE